MGQNNGHMPIGLDFITPTLVIVLHLFTTEPMQQFHEREVVRRTGVSKGSANKILRMLENIGMLHSERKGKMVFYTLDIQDPVARQFKVLENVYSLSMVRQQIKDQAKKIVLFGSCAQGTDVGTSDIDLFVLTQDKDMVRKKISDFNRKNPRKIAPIITNANEYAKLRREDKPLNDNIERGITLWQSEI